MCLFKKQKKVIDFKFGVPYFDIYDTAYPEFPISVSVRGKISLTVNDYKKFLKENDVTFFENKIKTIIISCAKNVIGNVVCEYDICACHIERHISAIENLIYQKVFAKLKSTFKINNCTITLTDIEIDKTTETYQKLSAFTQERAFKKLETDKNFSNENIAPLSFEREKTISKKRIGRWIVGGISLIAVGVALFFLLT